MKKREITATGMINNNGGLQMYMGKSILCNAQR